MESVLTLQDFGFVIVISKRIYLFWGIWCFYTTETMSHFAATHYMRGLRTFETSVNFIPLELDLELDLELVELEL